LFPHLSAARRYDGGGSAAPSTSLGTGGFGGGGGGGRQDRFMTFAQIKEETATGCPTAMWVQARVQPHAACAAHAWRLPTPH
jgi:hypothetical protein